jgi:enamine deaminase RidA (YjgF/YER057c/UK114 family)
MTAGPAGSPEGGPPGAGRPGGGSPEARLAAMGLELPAVAAPLAAYVPAVRTGAHVYTAGQLPLVDGALLMTGKVGEQVSTAEAAALARVCALNALAAIASVTGCLSSVVRVVKVTGFVASVPGFTDQAQVVNGASELLLEVFGEAGRHARSAVGMAVLPFDAPVEVELIAEVSVAGAASTGAAKVGD